MSKSSRPPSPDSYLNCIHPCISREDNLMLTGVPSSDEIRNIVFDMQPWTTPGPDGFPPGFYQKMWSNVGPDVVNTVQAFFHSKFLLKQLNHNFITLIPKTNCPKKIG